MRRRLLGALFGLGLSLAIIAAVTTVFELLMFLSSAPVWMALLFIALLLVVGFTVIGFFVGQELQ